VKERFFKRLYSPAIENVETGLFSWQGCLKPDCCWLCLPMVGFRLFVCLVLSFFFVLFGVLLCRMVLHVSGLVLLLSLSFGGLFSAFISLCYCSICDRLNRNGSKFATRKFKIRKFKIWNFGESICQRLNRVVLDLVKVLIDVKSVVLPVLVCFGQEENSLRDFKESRCLDFKKIRFGFARLTLV
jgi:hypothetical protein